MSYKEEAKEYLNWLDIDNKQSLLTKSSKDYENNVRTKLSVKMVNFLDGFAEKTKQTQLEELHKEHKRLTNGIGELLKIYEYQVSANDLKQLLTNKQK